MSDQENKSSKVALVVAWLIVGIPGLWGVEQTVMKSLPLFNASASAAVPTTAPATMK